MCRPIPDSPNLSDRLDDRGIVHGADAAVREAALGKGRRDCTDGGDFLARQTVRAKVRFGCRKEALGAGNSATETSSDTTQDGSRCSACELLVDDGPD